MTQKIKRDGIYDLNDVHRIFDDLVINRKGLRKEGNFYIDDNPYDSAGVRTACFSFWPENNGFATT